MNGATMDRVPPLEGALNFRDLGGYLAADGRRVRWNRVYRSGTTHAMTPGDLTRLGAHGIRFAYDLRSNVERRDQPNRLREIPDLDYRYCEHDHMPGDLKRLLRSPDVRAEHAHQVMIDVYQKLPYEFDDVFRSLFQMLVNGDVPIVFNCTAGKDRTGVAAALVLTALGVDRNAVLEDYLLSGLFFERSCELILKRGGMPLFDSIDKTVWEPLMRVHSDYLDAMFDRLRSSHGSVDRYLQHLGVDAQRQEKLRTQLLE